MYSNENYLLELLMNDYGLISADDAEHYRSTVMAPDSIISQMVTDLKVTEEQVAQVCAQSSGVEYIDLEHTPIAPDVLEAVSEEVARRYNVVPVSDTGGYLVVALADPLNFEALDSLPQL